MINEISPTELKDRLAKGEHPILLDVRQPEEHEDENIPGSILIPLGELPERIEEIMQHKDDEIIVYCRSGNRSGQACMFLSMSGFSNTRNLRGGMLSW